MDWKESCRQRLPALLDANGDLAPPWQRFPTYERYCLGWRMGGGEDWLGLWHVFLDSLPRDEETRRRYLARHRPAPMTWAGVVQSVLAPGLQGDDREPEVPVVEALFRDGFIAVDAAYETWLSQQKELRFPWSFADSPAAAARYDTRELWFSSRQLSAATDQERAVDVPPAWQLCQSALYTRDMGPLVLTRGLESLAQMLVAGEVAAPWSIGASLDEFEDSFEDDMGFVDAFRLWGASALDGSEALEQFLIQSEAPPEWGSWFREELGYESPPL